MLTEAAAPFRGLISSLLLMVLGAEWGIRHGEQLKGE